MNLIYEAVADLIREWLAPRTVFACFFYGTTVYLWCIGKEVPAALLGIVTTLMTHYFLTKGKDSGVTDDAEDPKTNKPGGVA